MPKSIFAATHHNQLAEELQKKYTYIETDAFEAAERYLLEQP